MPEGKILHMLCTRVYHLTVNCTVPILQELSCMMTCVSQAVSFLFVFFLMAAHWCSFLSEKYVLCSWRKMIGMSLLSPCGFYSRPLILFLAPDMRHTSQALATKRYFWTFYFLRCHIAKGRNEPTYWVFSHGAAIAFHFRPAAHEFHHYSHLFYSC